MSNDQRVDSFAASPTASGRPIVFVTVTTAKMSSATPAAFKKKKHKHTFRCIVTCFNQEEVFWTAGHVLTSDDQVHIPEYTLKTLTSSQTHAQYFGAIIAMETAFSKGVKDFHLTVREQNLVGQVTWLRSDGESGTKIGKPELKPLANALIELLDQRDGGGFRVLTTNDHNYPFCEQLRVKAGKLTANFEE